MKTCFLIAASAALAAGSALGDLARGMAPGAWEELKTEGLDDGFLRWAPGHFLQWTDRGAWDPVTRRFLFLGGAHAPDPGNKKFMSYSEADNTWRKLPDPPWLCVGTGSSCVWHGYEHIALDAAGRELYYRPFGSANVYRYDLDSDRWIGALPPIPESSCCGTLAYFPERGSLLYADGYGLQEYGFRAGEWISLAGPKAVPMGDYNTMGIYNLVLKAFIFGGGNGSRNLYKLAADGKITALRPAPFPLSIGKANLMADPWSGTHLVIGKLEFEDPLDLFYYHDAAADRWERDSASQPIGAHSGQNTSIAAAPVPALGVVFILRYDYGNPQAFLYKSKSQAPAPVLPGPIASPPPASRSSRRDVLGRQIGLSGYRPSGPLPGPIREASHE